MECLQLTHRSVQFYKNEKKRCQNFTKEQQKFCEQYKWLNTVNVKLSDTQLKKLETAAKNKTRTTPRMSLKMFHGNDLPHELLLPRRQKAKKCP